MKFAEIGSLYPKKGTCFNEFLRPIAPPLDPDKLTLNMWQHLEQDEDFPLPVTGDASLVLNYKGCPGAVMSFSLTDDELIILQLQGAHSKKGYRITTGLRVTDLFVREIGDLAEHPSLQIRRIRMPNEIEGLKAAASSLAEQRYKAFAYRLGMIYSHQERSFIKELPALST